MHILQGDLCLFSAHPGESGLLMSCPPSRHKSICLQGISFVKRANAHTPGGFMSIFCSSRGIGSTDELPTFPPHIHLSPRDIICKTGKCTYSRGIYVYFLLIQGNRVY